MSKHRDPYRETATLNNKQRQRIKRMFWQEKMHPRDIAAALAIGTWDVFKALRKGGGALRKSGELKR